MRMSTAASQMNLSAIHKHWKRILIVQVLLQYGPLKYVQFYNKANFILLLLIILDNL